MRIQRWLAQLGLGSRREIEKWIQEGQVLVNSQKAQLGQQLHGDERLLVRGKKVNLSRPSTQILLMNKPFGCITSRSDPDGRPTVYHYLPRCPHGQWQNVGRLDFGTTGLLLFTNNGHIVERLTHPKHHVRRGYKVKCQRSLTNEVCDKLTSGISLEDGIAHVDLCEIKSNPKAKNTILYLEVSEGRNRLIRRIMDKIGFPVLKLKRVRFGPWVLPDDLPSGKTLTIHPDHWPQWLKELK